MPYLPVGASKLYYETTGEGPAIVFAHGVGGNHASWFNQIPVFARSYCVVTFDHRGFGCSTDVERSGRSAFVSDLCALLDHLEIDRAVLIGQSMGGGTAIAFAAAHPDRVRALAIASSLHAIAEPIDVASLMNAARASTAGLDQLDRVLDAGFRAANPAQAVLYSAIASLNEMDRHTLTGDWPTLVPVERIGAGKPVLFLAATRDPIFPVEAIRRVHASVPGAFLTEIDAGHSAFFEAAAAFNDSILSFLVASGIRGMKRCAHSNAAGYAAAASNETAKDPA